MAVSETLGISWSYLGVPYDAGSVPLFNIGFECGNQRNEGFGPGDCLCIPRRRVNQPNCAHRGLQSTDVSLYCLMTRSHQN